MAKKSSKSKVVRPLVRKYQSAGYNMSGIDPTVRSYYLGEDAANSAESQYKSLYNKNKQFAINASQEENQAAEERKQANKELEQYSKERNKEFVSGAASTLAQEGTSALAKQAAEKELVDKAAKKAFEKASKKAVKEAGAAAIGTAPTVPTAAAEQAATQVGGVGGVGWGALSAANKTAEAAAAAGQGAKILGSNMSGLASAGIGLGLTGAGMLVNKRTNDNDFTTFTNKEEKGMKWAAGLQGAGSGFSTGAALGSAIPGVGNIVGGVVGAGIGAGLALKNAKEDIKDAKEAAQDYQDRESRRKAALASQDAQLAAAYNAAFVKSRLSGKQTGFGLNSSTTPGMDTTSSFYGKTGGYSVPGGKVVPIEGSDAVKFEGRPHSKGGIKLDGKTEVEGGETMDQVMMSGGKSGDYFFSKYLKLGGKSFAKHHEEILKEGGSQAKIQQLAKLQELAANKKGEKDRSPDQIAAYGGIHKYQTAGPSLSAGPSGTPVYKPIEAMTEDEYKTYMDSERESQRPVAPNLPWVKGTDKTPYGNPRAVYDFGTKPPAATSNSKRPNPDSTAAEQVDSKSARTPQQSADAQSNKTAKAGATVRDQNQANAKAPSAQQSVAPGGTTNNAGQAATNAARKATNANTTGTGSSANKTSKTNTATSGNFDQRLFMPGQRSGQATNEALNFIGFPKGTSALSKDDEGGTSMSIKGVPAGQKTGKRFYGNVTEMEYSAMKTANPWFDFTNFDPSNKDQVLKFQQEYNKRVKSGEKLKEDGKFGQQTVSSRLYKEAPAETPKAETPPGETPPANQTPAKGEEKKAQEQARVEIAKKGVNGSLIAGLAQLIPVGYALAKPYKAAEGIDSQYVGAGSVRGAILPRVNMNAERAATISNTVAVRKMAESQSGPGSMIAAIAAGGQQNDQMLAIANQEQRANRELIGKEAELGQRASEFNATQAQTADMANAENASKTDMFNKQLEVSEKQYKREGTLNALDAAAARIAGVVKDERSYRAQERLAKALDATGSYDRFTIYEQLQKEAKNSDSPYHNMTDVQLKKIASDAYNQQWGQQGNEGGGTAKTGGARKYTSRLGQLSVGRKTFNI